MFNFTQRQSSSNPRSNTPKTWSVTAWPPHRLSSPSSILPPSSSHCAVIPARKNSAWVCNILLFHFSCFLYSYFRSGIA